MLIYSIYNNSTLIFSVYFHQSSLFVSWQRIPNTFTVNKSSSHTLILLLIYDNSVLQFNLQSAVNFSYRLSLYRHGTDHAENTVLLLRNLTTGHREPSCHYCLLSCLQNCLARSCNIRYNNGLPIVVMQY
jgi:hypothetical protein